MGRTQQNVNDESHKTHISAHRFRRPCTHHTPTTYIKHIWPNLAW